MIPQSLTPASLLTSLGNHPADRMPAVGELWETAWNGNTLGLVLIAAVRDTHVVVWPVTDESLTPSDPCFKITTPHVEAALVCWPEAEAGVSTAALSRNLGHVANPDVLLQIWRSLRNDTITPDASVETYPLDESDEADDALAHVCDWVTLLGRLDFPDPDELTGTLSGEFTQEHQIDARTLKNYVEGPPAIVRDIFTGRRIPPPETITRLSEHYNVDPHAVVQPLTGWEVTELRSPHRKDRITNIAHLHTATENEVRLMAWTETQKAARQQSGGSARDQAAARVDRALDLLEN